MKVGKTAYGCVWLEAYNPPECASITSRRWSSLRAGTGVHAANLDTQGGHAGWGGEGRRTRRFRAALAYSELEVNLRYRRPVSKYFKISIYMLRNCVSARVILYLPLSLTVCMCVLTRVPRR